MIGYHATLKNNGLSILKDRKIKLTNDVNSVYGTGNGIYKTSKGYIYLATTIERALDFGLRAWGRKYQDNKSIEKELYIFEIKLNDEIEKFVDEDEVMLEGLNATLKKMELINGTQSYRVNKALNIGIEVVKYAIVKFKDLNEGYEFIDSRIINKIIKWNKLN
jgi:hypothetical protein